MKIVIDLDEETAGLLATLAFDYSESRSQTELVRSVLEHLVASASDGVRRPGAWERGWVIQAFSEDFTARLEPDPAAEWRQRPQRKHGDTRPLDAEEDGDGLFCSWPEEGHCPNPATCMRYDARFGDGWIPCCDEHAKQEPPRT